MCSKYGLGGGPLRSRVRFELPPTGEAAHRRTVAEWAEREGGEARITGRRARNLNPVIHALRGEREVELGWWWLHVDGVPAPFSAFNSRDDALTSKWSGPLQHRGILPASWYVEKGRVFALPRDEEFGIAALLAPVGGSSGARGPIPSYSMVTRASLGAAREAHPRMPLLLPRDLHDAWVDPARRGDAGLVAEAVAASDELAGSVVDITPASERPAAPTLF